MEDDYDYVDDPNYISVTTLMKPLRQIVLERRNRDVRPPLDVIDIIPSALGKTIHSGVEKAWLNYRANLKKLGISQKAIDRIRINPEDDVLLNEDIIPIFVEQRGIREINGWKVGGKFDLVVDGSLEDNKSTSTYTWTKGTRDDEHKLQGSLYRWIDAARNIPRITSDDIRINYVFTDWSKIFLNTDNYPQTRVAHKDISLLSTSETHRWVSSKLALIDQHMNTPEHLIPECTEEELWLPDPKFKYYSDPAKATEPGARSTKNFDNLADANAHLAAKGKGTVVTVIGKPKRCEYCRVSDICTQKDKYVDD